MTERGNLYILSGPSGVGKGTVRKALFEAKESNNLIYSISATTREPRMGEKDGIDYFFISKNDFEKMIQDADLLEYNEYVGNYYGTPKPWVEKMRNEGKDVFLEMDVNGAMQVRAKVSDAIFIFLLPPDIDQLRNRLELRGSESEDVINQRLKEAKNEILMMANYDYAVVNDKVEEAVKNIQAIISASSMKVSRIAAEYIDILDIKEEK